MPLFARSWKDTTKSSTLNHIPKMGAKTKEVRQEIIDIIKPKLLELLKTPCRFTSRELAKKIKLDDGYPPAVGIVADALGQLQAEGKVCRSETEAFRQNRGHLWWLKK